MQPERPVLISVVIPVKNGAVTIGECLESLLNQTMAARMEIIVIDSGSTDGTLEVLKKYPVRLLEIDPGAFNHGLTRNYGISHANGSFAYLTVQDSRQRDHSNLEGMFAHFNDAAVAGVCGTQGTPDLPAFNPVQWYNPVEAPTVQRIQFPGKRSFDSMTPEQQAAACAWDNVNAMYRKSVLEKYPFPKAEYGEDMAWAKTVLSDGSALVRDSGAVVYHYHYRTFSYSFKVDFTYHYFTYQLFHARPSYPPVVTNIAKAAYRLHRNHRVKSSHKIQWFLHNIGAEAAAWYAVFVFRRALRKKSGSKLTEIYQYYCRTVPQGRLKVQNPK
jgi:rhamnosyltransferase